jgi:hypothetical protein
MRSARGGGCARAGLGRGSGGRGEIRPRHQQGAWARTITAHVWTDSRLEGAGGKALGRCGLGRRSQGGCVPGKLSSVPVTNMVGSKPRAEGDWRARSAAAASNERGTYGGRGW